MFTSHETEQDYHHFFNSIVGLLESFQIAFSPRYMVTDAAQAMANSIKKKIQIVQLSCAFFI